MSHVLTSFLRFCKDSTHLTSCICHYWSFKFSSIHEENELADLDIYKIRSFLRYFVNLCNFSLPLQSRTPTLCLSPIHPPPSSTKSSSSKRGNSRKKLEWRSITIEKKNSVFSVLLETARTWITWNSAVVCRGQAGRKTRAPSSDSISISNNRRSRTTTNWSKGLKWR